MFISWWVFWCFWHYCPEPFTKSALISNSEYDSCNKQSCTKSGHYDSFTSPKWAHMLSCRTLEGMHLSALTGSQTAWRRMQEKRECLFPPCCHAHKLHDDGSRWLSTCWPQDSETAASSLLTSTLISHFQLFSLSLISSVPAVLSSLLLISENYLYIYLKDY